jgi:hypothetical protein
MPMKRIPHALGARPHTRVCAQVELGLAERLADEVELTVARMLFNTPSGCAPLATEDVLYNWW